MSHANIQQIIADIQKQKWVPETLAYSNTTYGQVRVCVYNVDSREPVVMFKAEKFTVRDGFSDPKYYETFQAALTAIGLPEN